MTKKRIKLNKQKARRIYENFKKDSQEILDDKDKTIENLDKAQSKAQKIKEEQSTFSTIFEDFKLLGQLVRAYINKEYRQISKSMIITAMGAIIYFLSPIDLIVDFIPGIGYIDDVFVISQVIKKLHEELYDFKVWRDQKLESKIK